MPFCSEKSVPSHDGVGSLAKVVPRHSHESLDARQTVFMVRSKPKKLFRWLKKVWYITTSTLGGAPALPGATELWSMMAKPPSPLSAETQVPLVGNCASVPLSWVPPMVRFWSVGCTATLTNWMVPSPVVLRLIHGL